VSRLTCPFCGPRELEEFEFLKTAPPPGSDPVTSVYLRLEPADSSTEHWQHAGGCRAWLKIVRNPWTGQVITVEMIGSRAP
jgi:sarcosine oxidase subunit delta